MARKQASRQMSALKKNRAVDRLADEVAPWWNKNYTTIGKREVATWKGTLVLMFFTGIAAALIWSAKTDFHDSTQAAAASTLYFNPATVATSNGAVFTVAPTINTGTNSVSIVSLKMTFDNTKLTLNNITVPAYSTSTPFYNPETAGFDPNDTSTAGSAAFATYLANANTTGKINFDLSVGTTHASAKGIFSIATLTFTSKVVSTTTVAFASTSGASADNETVNVVTGTTPANVTINIADGAPPTGGSITYANAYITTLSVALTAADGTDPTTGINTSTRTVQRRSATLSSGTCGTYGSFSTITPSGTYPNYTDTTVAAGNCYQYQYLVSDNATPANQAIYTSTNVIKTDTTSPAGGSITYTDGYYGTTSVTLTAGDGTDTISGINTASRLVQRKSATLSNGNCGSFGSFATITTTGSYPNFTDTSVTTGNCYQYQYLVSNNAGLQAVYTTTNTAKVDTTSPTGGSITYTDGYYGATSVALTAGDGTDTVSGINTGSRLVQRKSATLSNGTCGAYGSFATITPSGSYPNFTDTTVGSGNCYQYQYLVSNNAGKQAIYTTSSTAKVDTASPAGGSITYTDGYNSIHSIILTASDGTDTISGINTASRLVQRRSATIAAGACGTYGGWSTITTTGTYPSLVDATMATGNCYQYQYSVADNAGKQVTYSTTNTVKATYRSDLNLSGNVDYLDYGTMHTNYGVAACGNVADIDGSCTVDYLDYGILHSEYDSSLL